MNPPNLQQAFLRQGIAAQAIEILNDSAVEVDWPRVLRETRQVDLVVVPEVFWQGGRDPLKPPSMRNVGDRSLGEYPRAAGGRGAGRRSRSHRAPARTTTARCMS